jgi:hypothetical protein
MIKKSPGEIPPGLFWHRVNLEEFKLWRRFIHKDCGFTLKSNFVLFAINSLYFNLKNP